MARDSVTVARLGLAVHDLWDFVSDCVGRGQRTAVVNGQRATAP